MRPQDEIELTIERMVAGGDGMARHEGRVIFVPYVMAGERVRARLTTVKRHWARAELVALLAPSPERIAPRCAHFGPSGCGGCQWQHIDYAAQLRYKAEIVREQLQRIAKIADPPVRPTLGMDEPWQYRNSVQLHATAQGPGFVRADQRGVLPLRECHIMNRAVAALFAPLRGHPLRGVTRLTLRGSERTGSRLRLGEGQTQPSLPLADDAALFWQAQGQPPPADAQWTERIDGHEWQVGAGAFFQVNSAQAERMVALVRELAQPLPAAGLLLDLYAGVGLFGLSLAAEVGQVVLVESDPVASASARAHAKSFPNARVIAATSESLHAAWPEDWAAPDLIILDPPRAGCDPTVVQMLGKWPTSTIIYIACDPATQARDIRELRAQGFALEVVQPIDMFPQTFHIESVARLRRHPVDG
ncbi:MAG: class I SAM-dependent RNA methyltransferase [Anaerolineales bacterium]|nr:class I SAM-dependent RNA methyltransferase [Anaerolineales bacterium]MCB9128111.1 class I SAM-dependent RNA methyltransferase [Ardenticatenales bacterium]MCB9171824.1 class I SAM-dependent RNA methyltransferase [Ardenticatenales bacterium]